MFPIYAKSCLSYEQEFEMGLWFYLKSARLSLSFTLIFKLYMLLIIHYRKEAEKKEKIFELVKAGKNSAKG